MKPLRFFLVTCLLMIIGCEKLLEPQVTQPQISFLSRRDGNLENYIMDYEGGNKINLTRHTGPDEHPYFSPDGKLIAFTSFRNDHENIYIMHVNCTNQKNLTNGYLGGSIPVFSPDGSKILLVSDRDGNSELYLMDYEFRNHRAIE